MGKHKYSAKRAANSPKNKLERSLAQELPASQSLDDEIHSLVALLNDRAKDLVLRRWGYIEWPIPTLESLGARNGVTRERVRQIVSDHNARLKDLAYEGKIALPFAVSVCGLLLERPGATREELQVDVQASGIPASDSALRTLPALADLGMVPPVYLDSQTELWFSGPRAVEFSDPENPWHGEVRHMLTRSRASVRRTGAVHVSRV